MHPLNFHSLLIHARVNGNSLGTATGFVAQHKTRHFLITNWHVVSGRHPDTDKIQSATGGIPDELIIAFHSQTEQQKWEMRSVSLFDTSNRPRWIEHPRGKSVDVVALPLEMPFDSLDIRFVKLDDAVRPNSLWPGQKVVTIGYPLGLSVAGFWPIWKTGHIASEPSLGFRGQSAFLIDSTTRIGMSGSPVFVANPSSSLRESREDVLQFAGIYSGRVLDQSEVGIVWEAGNLAELFESGIRSRYVPLID